MDQISEHALEHSVAARNAHAAHFEGEYPLASYASLLTGTHNPGLSSVCEYGMHDLCSRTEVRLWPGAVWRCHCLCHNARREP